MLYSKTEICLNVKIIYIYVKKYIFMYTLTLNESVCLGDCNSFFAESVLDWTTEQ